MHHKLHVGNSLYMTGGCGVWNIRWTDVSEVKQVKNIGPIYFLKGIVHPKMKLYWNCPQSQAIQDVDEFVSSSDLEKCSIISVSQ